MGHDDMIHTEVLALAIEDGSADSLRVLSEWMSLDNRLCETIAIARKAIALFNSDDK